MAGTGAGALQLPGGAGEAAEDTAQPSEVVGPLQLPLFAWGLLLIARLFI